jgi:A/G-specific adenine glycosylase
MEGIKSHITKNRKVAFPQKKVDEFVKVILDFYSKYGRHELIWRKNITPYKILVSEIMLQQTQVERVLPKYTAWLESYGTLNKLSSARSWISEAR